jgi:hypothetical protein
VVLSPDHDEVARFRRQRALSALGALGVTQDVSSADHDEVARFRR